MNRRITLASGKFAPFRSVPLTGVIYVMNEARKQGFTPNNNEWVNFGQGQPECGVLSGELSRITKIKVNDISSEYGPVNGLYDLRSAVAEYYNRTYRKGKKSKYTAENIAISPGGRAGLTRVIAAMGNVNLGHFLPDYTAYEELLGTFQNINPIPVLLEPENLYEFSPKELQKEVGGKGLGAILFSNPCNPTGKLICQDELELWISIFRNMNCVAIIDEFYSRYIWDKKLSSNPFPHVSAAEYVEDVETDPILLIDGLTKNWRYPGFRISWTVGPKKIIDAISSAGSFLDGGANHPCQLAAIPLLQQDIVEKESIAIQNTFSIKRQVLISGLKDLGIEIDIEPQGTFYVWGSIKNLNESNNLAMNFFKKALTEKLIVVPGEFFDVNPGGRRFGMPSRFRHHIRFSFGPPLDQVKEGLRRLARVIKNTSYVYDDVREKNY